MVSGEYRESPQRGLRHIAFGEQPTQSELHYGLHSVSNSVRAAVSEDYQGTLLGKYLAEAASYCRQNRLAWSNFLETTLTGIFKNHLPAVRTAAIDYAQVSAANLNREALEHGLVLAKRVSVELGEPLSESEEKKVYDLLEDHASREIGWRVRDAERAAQRLDTEEAYNLLTEAKEVSHSIGRHWYEHNELRVKQLYKRSARDAISVALTAARSGIRKCDTYEVKTNLKEARKLAHKLHNKSYFSEEKEILAEYRDMLVETRRENLKAALEYARRGSRKVYSALGELESVSSELGIPFAESAKKKIINIYGNKLFDDTLQDAWETAKQGEDLRAVVDKIQELGDISVDFDLNLPEHIAQGILDFFKYEGAPQAAARRKEDLMLTAREGLEVPFIDNIHRFRRSEFYDHLVEEEALALFGAEGLPAARDRAVSALLDLASKGDLEGSLRTFDKASQLASRIGEELDPGLLDKATRLFNEAPVDKTLKRARSDAKYGRLGRAYHSLERAKSLAVQRDVPWDYAREREIRHAMVKEGVPEIGKKIARKAGRVLEQVVATVVNSIHW
jgi:hypothetical protein